MTHPNQPKISIVTVCLNAGDVLERTIQSVAEQTYPHLEYLVIDGCSTDGTLKIAEEYSDHIDILISEPDRNLYDAMNKAMKVATGDYIQFLNAGDVLASPQVLSSAMQDHRGEAFLYGRTVVIHPGTQTRSPWHKKHPRPSEINRKLFRYGMRICHQSMFVHRNLWVEYRIEYELSADVDWCIRILERAETCRDLDLVVVHYLNGGLSKQRYAQSLKERFLILSRHYGLLPTLFHHILLLFGRAKP
jgi:glycosyltransferase involved in cell wall biosynthesis